MMTAIAITMNCSWMPSRCCQKRTDSPKDAPSDSTTVPTMTPAATTLRVMISMMMKIIVSAATPAINRSYLLPSSMSLKVEAVPPRYTLDPSNGVPLMASNAAPLMASMRSMPSADSGSSSWEMMNRTAWPFGEMKLSMPRLKSLFSKISGGR